MNSFLQFLSRSGPCIDSPAALRFVLRCLNLPVLRQVVLAARLKFTPEILAAIRASDLPAPQKSRLFSEALNLFRSGATFKTTGGGRTPLTDAALLRLTPPGGLVLETGVSDGVSALGLLEARGATGVLLSDRQAGFRFADRGPLRVFYGAPGDPLLVKLPLFCFCPGTEAGPAPAGAGFISLLNPAVEAAFPGAGLLEFDVFTGVLPDPVAAIKCANVLNKSYFTPSEIRLAAGNLLRSLKEGGRLFLAQTHPGYEGGEACLVLRRSGEKLILEETLGGHELLADLRGPVFGDLVRGAA